MLLENICFTFFYSKVQQHVYLEPFPKKNRIIIFPPFLRVFRALSLSSSRPSSQFSDNSNERQFLKDFVGAVPGSAGARLAMWLQPESRLDPNKCELKPIVETIRLGWPTHLTIITRDQYGEPVYVPNLMVCMDKLNKKFIPI